MPSILDLQPATAKGPTRTLIYSLPGLGKTSLGNEYPNPAFIQTEEGNVKGLVLPSFGEIKTFADVMTSLGSAYDDEHDRKTIVLDTIDKFESLVWKETCERNDWPSIEAPGFGKGYMAADDVWDEFIQLCDMIRRDRGMNIVIIGHSEVGRFDDPLGGSFSKYNFRLQKRAHEKINDWCDAVLFINQDAQLETEKQGFKKERNIATGMTHWIHTAQRPSLNAKNRYNMPARLLYSKGAGFKELAKYYPPEVLGDAVAV